MLDQEKKQEPKQEAPKPKPDAPKPQESKHEEAKKIEKGKEQPKVEEDSWFAASMNKFRSLKKKMFSALSFLPQTGEIDQPPEENENLMLLTNQQKLGLFDIIVNEEKPTE